MEPVELLFSIAGGIQIHDRRYGVSSRFIRQRIIWCFSETPYVRGCRGQTPHGLWGDCPLKIICTLFSGKRVVKTVQLISFLALAVAYQAFPMLRILGVSHVDGSWKILGYQHLDAVKAGSVADHQDSSGLYSRFGHKESRRSYTTEYIDLSVRLSPISLCTPSLNTALQDYRRRSENLKTPFDTRPKT
jgi:hypothetical protein